MNLVHPCRHTCTDDCCSINQHVEVQAMLLHPCILCCCLTQKPCQYLALLIPPKQHPANLNGQWLPFCMSFPVSPSSILQVSFNSPKSPGEALYIYNQSADGVLPSAGCRNSKQGAALGNSCRKSLYGQGIGEPSPSASVMLLVGVLAPWPATGIDPMDSITLQVWLIRCQQVWTSEVSIVDASMADPEAQVWSH